MTHFGFLNPIGKSPVAANWWGVWLGGVVCGWGCGWGGRGRKINTGSETLGDKPKWQQTVVQFESHWGSIVVTTNQPSNQHLHQYERVALTKTIKKLKLKTQSLDL